MKILIASDIHGSAHFCELLVNAINKEEADRILLLGDILYHGPRNDLPIDYNPKKVISMLNDFKEKIFCVRGNCEAEVDQMVLDFPVLADYSVFYLNDRLIYATHGHIFNIDNPPKLSNGDILLYGHTHVPMCMQKNGMVFMNPGSVSIPKENSTNSYMLYENGKIVWKKLLDGTIFDSYTL